MAGKPMLWLISRLRPASSKTFGAISLRLFLVHSMYTSCMCKKALAELPPPFARLRYVQAMADEAVAVPGVRTGVKLSSPGVDMSVQDYVGNTPEGRRERLLSIILLIKKLYPDAEESMKYRMPTYSLREGWVAVANQKNYISLYTCSPQHLASFRKAHPGIKTGKGCINFRDKDAMPLDDLQPVIRSAMENRH